MIDLETLLSIREDIRVGGYLNDARLRVLLVQMIDGIVGKHVATAIEDVGQQLRGPRTDRVFQEDACGYTPTFVEPKRLEDA